MQTKWEKRGNMLNVERYSQIMALLKSHESMKVDELGRILAVSENTVRRDLAHLEKNGLLIRIQGGATLSDLQKHAPSSQTRTALYQDEKQSIAREAAKLVRSNCSIIVDAGSTTLGICSHIKGLRNLTVITNSLEACNALAHTVPVSIILSGGVLLESTNSFVGKPAEAFFSSLHADILFLGAKGVSAVSGLSNENFYETPVKQKMIASADKIVLLADHSKFGREALSSFARLEDIDAVITDDQIEPQYVELLQSRGIEVIIAHN